VKSEGGEFDELYQKALKDIEEQTSRSGWLFGRGGEHSLLAKARFACSS
jgi:hypothetical protein